MSKSRARGLNTANLERYAESLPTFDAKPKPLSPLLPVSDIPLELLDPAPWNARRFFDLKQLQILGNDMLENGQIHPITVRQLAERFEVVVGERRMRAAQLVGIHSLRAHVRSLEDREARRIGLAENLQREDLNPYEETIGWLDLLALELETLPSFAAFQAPGEATRYAAARVLRRLQKERLLVRKGTAKVDDNVIIHFGPEEHALGRAERLVCGTPLEAAVESIFLNAPMTWESFNRNRLPILALPTDLLEVMYRGELEYTKAAELNKLKDEIVRADILERVLQLALPLTQVRKLVLEALQKPRTTTDELRDLARNATRRFSQRLEALDAKKRDRAEALFREIDALLAEG